MHGMNYEPRERHDWPLKSMCFDCVAFMPSTPTQETEFIGEREMNLNTPHENMCHKSNTVAV